MSKPEPTESQVIALFDGYWNHLTNEVLDGYRREFECRGWSEALEIVESEMATRWIIAHPQTIVGIVAAQQPNGGHQMNAVPANQTVSFSVYVKAVGLAAPKVTAAFLRSQDARITAAFDMGEPVWMIADEMKLRFEMTSIRATKTPRQLAASVVAL